MKLNPRILNLGAGVQSTTVALLELDGKLPACDHWIFADVQEEPEAVYKHLEWLKGLAGDRFIETTAGKIGDDLLRATNTTGDELVRFSTVPTFTKSSSGKVGRNKRQCTKEYKIEPVEKAIRRQVFGLEPGRMFPKGTRVTQVFGISWDERERAERIKANYEGKYWAVPEFPLLALRWTRDDCAAWLATKNIPHEVPRSACVFCPYKSFAEWLRLKQTDPAGWARAVEIDRGLRSGKRGSLAQPMFLVKQCIPLEEVDLEAEAAKEAARNERRKSLPLFSLMLAAEDCEDACFDGMCGV